MLKNNKGDGVGLILTIIVVCSIVLFLIARTLVPTSNSFIDFGEEVQSHQQDLIDALQ